jgi:hypothetical protein
MALPEADFEALTAQLLLHKERSKCSKTRFEKQFLVINWTSLLFKSVDVFIF